MKTTALFRNGALLASLLLFLLPAQPVKAAVVTLGAAGDVMLIQSQADKNFGAASELWVMANQQTSLIRFDLSGLQAESLESLTLGLYLQSMVGTGGKTNMTIFLRSPDAGNLGWVEGDGPAHPQPTNPAHDPTGSSTWNNRIHNSAQWTDNNRGAAGGATVTRAQIALNTSAEAGYREFTFTDPELLEQWRTAGEVNLLLLAWTSQDGVRAVFTSREGVESQRPYLNVTYEAVPEPGTAALLGGGVLLAAFTFWRKKKRP